MAGVKFHDLARKKTTYICVLEFCNHDKIYMILSKCFLFWLILFEPYFKEPQTFGPSIDYPVDSALYTVKPVYKGHSREPTNMPFMSSWPLQLYGLFINGKNEAALYRPSLVI